MLLSTVNKLGRARSEIGKLCSNRHKCSYKHLYPFLLNITYICILLEHTEEETCIVINQTTQQGVKNTRKDNQWPGNKKNERE